ncbi:hypothetical protein AB0L64_10010 [Kribbella sp. NPDC051936]|uniref:hypothetical protein n=1 Tax=Kribbella sp. NPDC051936 TaxID=3154946 RepID=UPI00341B6F82
MTEYIVAPLEEPEWVVDTGRFAEALAERWPAARVETGAVPGSTMALEALIPLEPAPRELGVALSGSGQAVSLEPADAEAAADFAEWFVRVVLPGQSGVHLIEPASMRTVELTGDLTAAEIRQRIG